MKSFIKLLFLLSCFGLLAVTNCSQFKKKRSKDNSTSDNGDDPTSTTKSSKKTTTSTTTATATATPTPATGFGSDPSLFYFAAVTGTVTDGDVIVTIDYPSDTTSYNAVQLRWVEEGTAPVSTCNGGSDGTHTVSAPFADQVTITLNAANDSLTAGTVYSLRACVTNSGGTVLQNPTVTNVASKGTFYRIFVTSAGYTGNLKTAGSAATGTAGADNLCAYHAGLGGYSGTWKAIISGDGVNASTRIANVNANFYNTQGDKVATSGNLFAGTITKAVKYTETGATATVTSVWSGSDSTGVLSSTPCVLTVNEWTAGSSDSGYAGDATVTTSSWLRSGGEVTCSVARALYCVSQ